MRLKRKIKRISREIETKKNDMAYYSAVIKRKLVSPTGLLIALGGGFLLGYFLPAAVTTLFAKTAKSSKSIPLVKAKPAKGFNVWLLLGSGLKYFLDMKIAKRRGDLYQHGYKDHQLTSTSSRHIH